MLMEGVVVLACAGGWDGVVSWWGDWSRVSDDADDVAGDDDEKKRETQRKDTAGLYTGALENTSQLLPADQPDASPGWTRV